MINLLPPNLKESRKFGKLNLFIVKQIVGVAFIGFLAALVMLSGLRLTQDDEDFLDESIAIKTSIYEGVKPFEEQANSLKLLVSNIEKLFDREVRFSKLLVDIASSIPVGAELTSLSLTGSSTEPLQITADTTTQELTGVLRKNLVDSGVFESADILNVKLVKGGDDTPDRYTVSITASLSGSAETIRKARALEAARAEAARLAAEESAAQ